MRGFSRAWLAPFILALATIFKTAAEIARQRLVHGLWHVGDAQSWADRIIVGMEKPHEWLIDVSTARTAAEAGLSSDTPPPTPSTSMK